MNVEALKDRIGTELRKVLNLLRAPAQIGESKPRAERMAAFESAILAGEDVSDFLAQWLRDLRVALDEASDRKGNLMRAMQRAGIVVPQPQ